MKKEEKKAKEIFSQYVRKRSCVETTGDTDYCKCITCGNIISYQEIQCGHFVSGRTNSLFFEETNSHGQCGVCNTSMDGNPEIYRKKMTDRYGEEEVERLELLRHSIRKIGEAEFKEIHAKFRAKFKNLDNE